MGAQNEVLMRVSLLLYSRLVDFGSLKDFSNGR